MPASQVNGLRGTPSACRGGISFSVAQGPVAWRNWDAYISGQASKRMFETALYSDAHFIGHSLDLGPYRVLNTLAWGQGTLGLALVLRAQFHLEAPVFDPETVR